MENKIKPIKPFISNEREYMHYATSKLRYQIKQAIDAFERDINDVIAITADVQLEINYKRIDND